MTKLTHDQEAVLRHLYENRDGDGPNIDQIAAATGLTPAATRKCLAELKEMGLVSGPPSLLERTAVVLKKLDENLDPTSQSYAESILLLASVLTRADEGFLADELGYDVAFVGTVGARLRAAGVWQGDKVSPARAAAYEADGLSFWLDVAVACGEVKVVGGTAESPRYQMTDDGRSSVARFLRPPGDGK